MKNSTEKITDIKRGVLPAKRRGAKSIRHSLVTARRSNRHQTKADLLNAKYYDDTEEFEVNVRFYPNARINRIVDKRRLNDNLSSLLRWAESKVKGDFSHMTDVEKYYRFKSILGDSLQGRHALGHIVDAYMPSMSDFQIHGPTYEERMLQRLAREQQMNTELRVILAQVVSCGDHKRLNTKLKETLDLRGCKKVADGRRQAWCFQHGTYHLDRPDLGCARYEIRYIRVQCPDCEFRTFPGIHRIDDFADYLMRHHIRTGPHHNAFQIVYNWFSPSSE